jgi:nicotinamide riboside kinase
MSHHIRNIYIIGAQSTGKTTLVKALEQHFADLESNPSSRPNIISEVARTVLIKHNFTASDIIFSPTRALALQKLILETQSYAERHANEQGGWFISDRSGVDPIVYARRYVSEDAATELLKSEEWRELCERMREGLVIVCEAGADWLRDDGVRLMPEDREDWIAFHKLFRSCLDEMELKHCVLPLNVTNIRERVEFVLTRWKGEEAAVDNGSI